VRRAGPPARCTSNAGGRRTRSATAGYVRFLVLDHRHGPNIDIETYALTTTPNALVSTIHHEQTRVFLTLPPFRRQLPSLGLHFNEDYIERFLA
jgi:hypothetical protein